MPGSAQHTDEIVQDVRVGRHDVHVSYRPGTGTPLLMCNGIGASLGMLQPFVDALDPSIPVVRFDAPGVGGSRLPRVPYTFATLAHTLGGVLDRLGIDRVDVLGISWGGGLAQQFAFQHPRRCRRLVLVSTATGWMMVPATFDVLAKMATPRRHRDAQYAASIAGSIYGGRLRAEPELARPLLHEGSTPTSRRAYLMQLGAGTGWTSLPFLPLIRQPTLVLAGDDDPIIPVANARMMARLLPHADLHVFPDGHLGLVTRADDLAPRVATFLGR